MGSLEKMGSGTLKKQFNSTPSQQQVNDFTGAAGGDKFTVVERFLNKFPDAVNEKDGNGVTALMRAGAHVHLDIVMLLVERGAALDKKDNYGRTALMHTVMYGWQGEETIETLLLEAGAAINEKDNEGVTVLMHAAGCRDVNVVEMLLKRGAAIDEKDASGKTALMHARENGHVEVAAFLEQRMEEKALAEDMADFSPALKRPLPCKGPLKLARKGM